MARKRSQPSEIDGKAAAALNEFSALTTSHDEFVARFERNRRAYEAVLERRHDVLETTHQLAPPYAEHIIETTIASMLDEQLRFKVTPRPRLYQSPEELQAASDGAKAFEIVLRHQMAVDRFDAKQRTIVLQERLAGMCPIKVYHRQTGRVRKTQEWGIDDAGLMVMTGVREEPEITQDGPCIEPCDVRDFYWDDQATDLQSCGVIVHRTWPTFEDCKRMQKLGYWSNVDELPSTRDFSASLSEREKADVDAKRGRIEVLEIWRRESDGIRVYTIGNRKVVLSERDNPFWHGQFPFVAFVGQSKLFRIPGRPQVEKLAALQEATWTIANQRLDNLMYINNHVTVINEDLIEDADEAEAYPGARWLSHGPANEAFATWAPNPVPAQVSIPAESMIKADMQNLAGGFPFTSTSEANNINASTATEASLVANLAQRSIIGAKMHLYATYREIGQMWIELNRQFTRMPVYALVTGADDAVEQREIMPWVLQGDFVFDIEPMTESLMRDVRRSEALSLFQGLVPALLPAAPALAQTGAIPNLKRYVDYVLENYGIQNTEAWWIPVPAQGAPVAPGGAGMGTPPSPENGANGVTNAQLAAGPLAPSNANSLSGGQATQQFYADTTPRNV